MDEKGVRMSGYMVTTMDNPYNPFKDYAEWYEWDHEYCWFTCEWLAIFDRTSIDLDPETNRRLADEGVNDFLAFNPYGMHFKVYEDEADELIPLANKMFEQTKGSKAKE